MSLLLMPKLLVMLLLMPIMSLQLMLYLHSEKLILKLLLFKLQMMKLLPAIMPTVAATATCSKTTKAREDKRLEMMRVEKRLSQVAKKKEKGLEN